MDAFMFPGQGCQRQGMGRELFRKFKELRDVADSVLGYSIEELCVTDPENKLGRTEFTQPAIFTASAMAYYEAVEERGKAPEFVAGHSLGELNALLAAEVFDFETGLGIVKTRGELMSRAKNGAMAVVFNAEPEEIAEILASNGLSSIDIANYNTPVQTVISGPAEDIDRAASLFVTPMGFLLLNTSGAFHSRYMRDASPELEAYLNGFSFRAPKITVISNATAEPYEADGIVRNLVAQLSKPVLWRKSMEYLIDHGVTTFTEVGSSGILTNMLSDIRKHRRRNEGAPKRFPAPAAAATPEAAREHAENALASNVAGSAAPWRSSATARSEARGRARILDRIAEWNRRYPIGTRVRSSLLGDHCPKTRTEAVVLFGSRPAVYLEGYKGYFDIEELTVVDGDAAAGVDVGAEARS